MRSSDLGAFRDWEERELERLVDRFVRIFGRLPDGSAELARFHRSECGLLMRVPPRRTRRTVAR